MNSTQIGCLLGVFVQDYWCFQVSLFLGGIFGGGLFVIAPLYLEEIANDR